MEKTVLRDSNSNETETLANGLIKELNKVDLSADVMISKVLADLTSENSVLTQGIEKTNGDVLRENLHEENETADADFVCLKQFVKANIYLPNAKQAQDAEDVWELISSHNLELHNLSYEKQISLSNSLLSNLASDKFKAKVKRLVGVSDRVQKLAKSSESLKTAYDKVIELESKKLSIIPPSTQKHEVRKIINENLIPYLQTSSKVFPETYEPLYKMACEAIGKLNMKVRTRKTRKANELEESVAD